MTEDEMVGWRHRIGGHEHEQAPGVGEGQGGLVCCSPWGHKESDTTWQLSNNKLVRSKEELLVIKIQTVQRTRDEAIHIPLAKSL